MLFYLQRLNFLFKNIEKWQSPSQWGCQVIYICVCDDAYVCEYTLLKLALFYFHTPQHTWCDRVHHPKPSQPVLMVDNCLHVVTTGVAMKVFWISLGAVSLRAGAILFPSLSSSSHHPLGISICHIELSRWLPTPITKKGGWRAWKLKNPCSCSFGFVELFVGVKAVSELKSLIISCYCWFFKMACNIKSLSRYSKV